jgi:hypothetical protein
LPQRRRRWKIIPVLLLENFKMLSPWKLLGAAVEHAGGRRGGWKGKGGWEGDVGAHRALS